MTTNATGGVHHAATPAAIPAKNAVGRFADVAAAITSVAASTAHALESQRWLATTAVSPSVTNARKVKDTKTAVIELLSFDTSQNRHAVRIAISHTTGSLPAMSVVPKT